MNKKNKNYKKKRAFTLVEVLLAVFILNIGILGTINLFASTIRGYSLSSNKFIAANLAQGGIEKVRNWRDSNWANGKGPWFGGLPSGLDEQTIILGEKEFIRQVSLADCGIGCKQATSKVFLNNKKLITIETKLYAWR